ncbi:unnamed protein product, partial [Phaeothamnion confervicola]
FAGAASAQSSSVTIYGTLQGDFQVAESKSADTSTVVSVNSARTAASFTATPANQSARTRSNPAGSNLGFRGTEDLGNGLSAWFQLEMSTTLGAPSGTPDGANHGNAPTWRNTAVGLRSNTWGTVSVGMWDTPFNLMAVSTGNVNGRIANATTGQQANLLGTTLFGQGAWSAQNESAACTGPAIGVASASCLNAGMNFDRRQKQLLQWWSPNWNGFEARVAYAAVGFADGVTADSRAAGSIKPSIWDLSLAYNNGPLAVGYAYSNQKNLLAYAAATAAATAYTFALGGGNSIGVGALWESLKWTANYATLVATDLTEMKKTAWRLQANYATGNHFFAFDYTKANDVKGSLAGAGVGFNGSGTEAKSYQLAYNYMLSKRT